MSIYEVLYEEGSFLFTQPSQAEAVLLICNLPEEIGEVVGVNTSAVPSRSTSAGAVVGAHRSTMAFLGRTSGGDEPESTSSTYLVHRYG